MTAASIDEALRNAVCVGVDLDLIAGLDNFLLAGSSRIGKDSGWPL